MSDLARCNAEKANQAQKRSRWFRNNLHLHVIEIGVGELTSTSCLIGEHERAASTQRGEAEQRLAKLRAGGDSLVIAYIVSAGGV